MSALTITIFVQAYELGAIVFSALLFLIFVSDLLVYWLIPYEVTTFHASFTVHTFLVYGMHGFGLSVEVANMKSWLIVLAMIVLRFTVWDPWIHVAPPSFMAPVAAHCTVTGAYYLFWKVLFLSYKNFDQISYFFGILLPDEPVIVIKDITETSSNIYWRAEPVYGVEVQRHLIEVNGIVVGETSRDETGVLITGLQPETRYRVRVWACAGRRTRTPSKTVLMKTLKSSPKASEDNARAIADSHMNPDEPEPCCEEPELDEQLARVNEEIASLKKQQTEIQESQVDAEEQFQREQAEINAEVVNLNNSRKAGEGPRAELKARIKTLEDYRRQADELTAKLETKLTHELKLRQETIDIMESRKQEMVALESDLIRIRAESKAVSTEPDARQQDLEKHVQEREDEISKLEAELSRQEKLLDENRKQISQRESQLQTIEADIRAAATDRPDSNTLDENSWYNLFTHLQEEHKVLQADLREENRLKMRLLQRLAELRDRERRRLERDQEIRRGGGGKYATWSRSNRPSPLPPPGFEFRQGTSNASFASSGVRVSSGARSATVTSPSVGHIRPTQSQNSPGLGGHDHPALDIIPHYLDLPTVPISPTPTLGYPVTASTDSLSLFRHGPVTSLITDLDDRDPFGFRKMVVDGRVLEDAKVTQTMEYVGQGYQRRASLGDARSGMVGD
ncbi:hypothetical protein SpCBS45565_g04124 [Spizellomyces sp. 'palustris']|nr:hypothetical protein SpCBS45565_g04124 [Spizellomyces sp. 'palustris']